MAQTEPQGSVRLAAGIAGRRRQSQMQVIANLLQRYGVVGNIVDASDGDPE